LCGKAFGPQPIVDLSRLCEVESGRDINSSATEIKMFHTYILKGKSPVNKSSLLVNFSKAINEKSGSVFVINDNFYTQAAKCLFMEMELIVDLDDGDIFTWNCIDIPVHLIL